MSRPKYTPVTTAKVDTSVSPPERISKASAAAATGAATDSDFVKHVFRATSLAQKEVSKAKKAASDAQRNASVTHKDIDRLNIGWTGAVNVSQSKIRHASLNTGVVAPGELPKPKGPEDTPEVRPDVPELNRGSDVTKTSYREPPKKPGLDRRRVPSLGNAKTSDYKWKPSSLGKPRKERTVDDLIVPRSSIGTSAVGSKPSRHATFSASGTSRANQPPTQSSSGAIAAKGSVGRAGNAKRDIKNRNTVDASDMKPTNDSISREMTSFLMEYVIKAPKNGIARWSPKHPFTPLRDLEPPPMPAPDPDAADPRMAELPKAAKALGIDLARGKRIDQSSRPKDKEAASKQLFGEDTMNPDKIANDIIREAFTSGDRNNTTPDSNGLDDKGGTARQMLAGEWFGSVAWPFDQPSNSDFAKSNQLQADQSVSGQGELVTGGAMESVGTEIVDSLLEDSPSSIYSDPQSVGYLINELQESGYAEQAAAIEAICENAKEEDVVKVVEMIDTLEADKADPFLIEHLAMFANLLIEEDETAKEEVPTGEDNKDEIEASNTGGSGL